MTDLRKQLEEILLKFNLRRAKSTRNYIKGLITEQEANESLDADLEESSQNIEALFTTELQKAELRARINEWHNIGNWNADKGIADLWPVIDLRLEQLKAELNQLEEKT